MNNIDKMVKCWVRRINLLYSWPNKQNKKMSVLLVFCFQYFIPFWIGFKYFEIHELMCMMMVLIVTVMESSSPCTSLKIKKKKKRLNQFYFNLPRYSLSQSDDVNWNLFREKLGQSGRNTKKFGLFFFLPWGGNIE